jgi:hypothetical protein
VAAARTDIVLERTRRQQHHHLAENLPEHGCGSRHVTPHRFATASADPSFRIARSVAQPTPGGSVLERTS